MENRSSKIEILSGLNWDYRVTPDKMLDVVDGKQLSAGPFDRPKILIRSLERLSWYQLIKLWGLNNLLDLWNPEIEKQIRSAELRRRYAYLFGLLRGKTISPPGWSPEMRKQVQGALFSNRWYRTKPGIL